MRTVLLALLFVLGMSSPTLAEKPLVGFITGSPGLGDQSFNDMAHAGVLKAQREFGFNLVILEPTAEAEATEKDVLDVIGKTDVTILLGAQHTEVARKAALQYPKKKCILLDAAIEDIPNVSSVMFGQHEGSFLAGALAAYVSASGKIGFVGGAKIPEVRAFEQGYREGAAYANPRTEILVDYTSPAGDYSGFSNPDKGFQLATGQFEKGADIIFAVAGGTGNGVIEAARRSGRLAIGVDADQDALAKGSVLTSMMKRLDVAAYNELKSVMENRFTPGTRVYGLKNGGVGLSESRYTRDKVPDAVMKKIDEIGKKIIAGEITVTDILSAK